MTDITGNLRGSQSGWHSDLNREGVLLFTRNTEAFPFWKRHSVGQSAQEGTGRAIKSVYLPCLHQVNI